MSNQTTIAPFRKGLFDEQLFRHSLWFVTGLIITVGDTIIVGTIALHRNLRVKSELVFMAAIAIVDFLYGMGFLTAGIRRIYQYVTDWSFTKTPGVSEWFCATVVHTFFLFVGEVAAPKLLLAISIDRLLAVTKVSAYRHLGKSYQISLICTPFILTFLLYGAGMYTTYIQPISASNPAICVVDHAFTEYFNMIKYGVEAICSILGQCIYATVMIILYLKTRSAVGNKQNHLKRQAKITKILGIICLVDLVLFVVPILINIYLTIWVSTPMVTGNIIPYVRVLLGAHSIANMIVYVGKHGELRNHVWHFITCRKVKQTPITPGVTSVISRPMRMATLF